MRAHPPSLVEGPQRLGGVLDQRQRKPRGEPEKRVEVDRVAVEVDGQDRADPTSGRAVHHAIAAHVAFAGEEVRDFLGVHRPRPRLRVHEDGADHRDVGKVGAAAVGVVQDPRLPRAVVLVESMGAS